MGEEERDEIIEEEEGAGEEPSAGGVEVSKIVKILLYVAGGILLIVLVTGISYLVSKNVQESAYQKRQDIIVAPPPPPLHSFDLQPFSKTTADAEPHFVKIEIALGYEHTIELNNELVNRNDQIRHIINIILQGKKYEDLDSVSDSVALAEEIKAHVNMILINGKIKEVYFKELVVN
ncbi:MAG TPA: flagellar basal body-associated FliL family protein [Spirochaetota bacterium]|nr:flagellar basal body-associated FliL family protein [Spirochaetota bacterium]HPI88575.1 flagellar basal body-associated FliL family protein [Spirochaetota bacterium]HPR48216.1 flagellar basal body-associated FliL family protein [Spirochaetota bacterium]